MPKEIIWFTTYAPNIETLDRFFSDNHLEISTFYSPTEKIYDNINRLIEEAGLKVVIIRGGYAAEIKNNISIPVVNIRQTVIDFANLFPKINQISKSAALIGWYSEVRGLEDFLKQSKVNIQYFDLKNCGFKNYAEYASDIIKRLKAEGVDLIVSGGAVMEIAKQYGMNTLYVGLLDDETILDAAAEARYQLRLLKEQESRIEFIHSVFNCVSEGIIAVNAQWKITDLNSTAARILGVSSSQCHGKPLENYLDAASLRNRLEQGKRVENQIFSISDKRLVVSAVPSVIHQKTVGVVFTLQQVDAIHNIEKKLRTLSVEKGHLAKKGFDDIIGHNQGLVALKKKAVRYAETDSTVLITGESGVGKELFAQGIHNHSPRRNAPFVAVNCASFPENLLESELFGYVRGAFTGARTEGKAGLFELANGGTIFLDEIGETPLSVQIRLLRVLQERSVIRIGGDSIIPLDVRVIVATNRNLMEEIQQNKFRQDLYYRLCVLPLHVMPLRERRDDILEIAYYLLGQHRKTIRFSPAAEQLLIRYDWPGNVRELSNFIERVLVLHDTDIISEKEVREILQINIEQEDDFGTGERSAKNFSRPGKMEQEKYRIRKALRENHWNRRQAAKQLGISTTTLWRKMKRYDISSLEEKEESESYL